VCERACFGDLGCDLGAEFCALRFTSGLGICRPLPVCGDGELGEINELCDDGNTIDGDGCSADCQTVEYGVICGGLDSISGDTLRAGDTAGGWDGFQASCQWGIARAELVEFVPPGFGRLQVWVESPTAQLVSVRTDCADSSSELGCAAGNDFAPEVTHQVVDAAPLTIVVSALTVLEEGPYTLHVEWTDEVCGDGVVAGHEACDDGNTGSGDGCSGDCLAVEYGVLCAAAATLAPGTPYAGDNGGGTNYFAASCSNDVYGSGPERLHLVTAPGAGTLRIRLDQGLANLTLAAYDACGAPSGLTELDCSSVYDIEELEIPVTAGQTVMVLVEGFGEEDVGPYSLTTDLLSP
jgi:cysteine-rich repeat protein